MADKEIVDVVVRVDSTITPALKAEGEVREFIRAVQSARKVAGLAPMDRIELMVKTTTAGEKLLRDYETEIKKVTGTTTITFTATESDGEEIRIGDHSFVIDLKKLNQS